MNVQFLIDSIVRQTTVLIAQLATSGGVRAPLAHIANQVFLELAAELDNQGVSRKVSADMFGMALRTYLRKIQRLSESSTERGRSLWEAVLDYLSRGELVTRADVLRRFHRDDEAQVRGVLKDLMDSGLVFCSGSGQNAVFRAATAEELGHMRNIEDDTGLDELLWATIYREGPLSRAALLKRGAINAPDLDEALRRLTGASRIKLETTSEGEVFASGELVIPLGASAGWEAAVFDHFQAMVRTICVKLEQKPDAATPKDVTGGSTYTLDIWDSHPAAEEASGLLREFRERVSALRQRVEAYNAEHGVPSDFKRVVVYLGQSVLAQDEK